MTSVAPLPQETSGVVRERIATFGSHRGLVGIVAEPDAAGAAGASARPAVLMANIGMHHRVGPFRLYVELSRAVARAGCHALRFDLGGLGDSAARPGATAEGEAALLDMTEAMDWMQARYGVEKFVLVGLCSGVDAVHAAALRDPRVTHAVFIDGYTYQTPGFHRRRLPQRYLRLDRWTRFLRRALHRRRSVALPSSAPAGAADRGDSGADADVAGFSREYPPLERFREEITEMARRGVRLLFVFTGTVDSRFNAGSQLWEMLGPAVGRTGIELEWTPGADHVFTSCARREALVRRVAAFASPPTR